MHWSELFVEDSNLSLPPDFMVFTDADGLVVVIELRLDEEAQPVRVPPWFNRDLLGAVGLTLHPNVFTLKRLVWWSEHSCAVGGQDDL